MYVVIMFTGFHQADEAFGTFKDEEDAENWLIKMEQLHPNRDWLILPLTGTNLHNLSCTIGE